MFRRITISAAFILSLFCAVLSAQDRDDSLYVYVIDTASVVTSGRAIEPVSGIMSGNLTIAPSALDELPRFMGVTDVMKIFKLMPGVQQTGEMDSGIYIRGADGGQTSVYLDGARVYAPNHLMGFFSSFNSDHIGSSTMYKGANAGAGYGGSLGGYISIGTKDGQPGRFTGCLHAGLLSSQATLGIPIGGKSALYLSGRGTYLNYMLKAIPRSGINAVPEYGFSDFNLTWLYKPDEKNFLKASAYFGTDNMEVPVTAYQATGALRWKNAAASISSRTETGNGIGLENRLHFSYFSNLIDIRISGSSFMLPSSIADFGYDGAFICPLPYGKIRGGIFYTLHDMDVQHPVTDNLYGLTTISVPSHVFQHDFGAYSSWSADIAGVVYIDAGLRLSASVSGNKLHFGPEPRVSLRYSPLPDMRISASYALHRQYISQVSVSGIGMPVDYWIPCTPDHGPQVAHCVSAGMAHSFGKGMFSYSTELYYSRMYGLTESDGGLIDMVSGRYDWTEHVLYGSGDSYGAELMFRKNKGRVTGWLGYTLGWAMRSFPDIASGAAFPAKQDRRHSLSAVVSWDVTDCISLSSVFVYATGSAFTMPSAIYVIGNNVLHEYGPHNGARMPDYHRLDLSATWDFLRTGRTRHSLNLSVYNAYARPNPLILDLKAGYDSESGTLTVTTDGMVLYTILPSLSYTLSF